MKKKIDAWAVLSKHGRLVPYGNGNQYQYPIFKTLTEANDWRKESTYNRGEVIMVEILRSDI